MANSSLYKIIDNATVGMIRGKKFSPKEITAFETAVMMVQMNNQTETMMLFFAEALKDVRDADSSEIYEIMSYLNDKLLEFIKLSNDNMFNIDDVRLRVYEKTNYIFPISDDDGKHVRELLAAHGYDIEEHDLSKL